MEIIFRTAGIYFGLLIIFRLMGKRSLSELSAFDLIVFLIVSEALQNALVDDDKSVFMGMTVVLTFLMLDLAVSLLKRRFGWFEKLVEGVPVILVEHGKPIELHLRKTRISRSDILQTARQQGLERMEQIKYAVLETTGTISVIPADETIRA